MFRRYKTSLVWIFVAVAMEIPFVLLIIWCWITQDVKGVIDNYLSVFGLATVAYFLMFNAFNTDALIYFEPDVKYGSLFIYFVGFMGLVTISTLYILFGNFPVLILWVTIITWFLALSLMILLTFKPVKIAKKLKRPDLKLEPEQ